MPIYRTDLEIAAPAERVWEVLTDFPRYGEWNPSLPSISGDLAPGSVVALRLGLPGRPSMNVRATLQEVEPNRRLTWRGHVGAARIFAGYREFALQPLDAERVMFTHVEDITGWLAPVFGALMGGPAQRGHDAFNETLRTRSQNGSTTA